MRKKASTSGVRLGFRAGLVAALGLGIASAAQAHDPNIAADPVCDPETNSIVIEYEAFSWTDVVPDGENPQVDVLLEGVVIDSGPFAAPDLGYSGSVPAPSDAQVGDLLVIRAVAVGDWGDGFPGGQSSGQFVEIPEADCGVTTADGRFTGGGSQIRVDGVRVTRGLTIHCDLLLSNNLQINWNGNRFHMTEHMTTVSCSDDPDITQAPPNAPLDTLVGTGTGRYNGDDGYTIEFTLVDAGEPGRDDMAQFLVYETADPTNVVLDVPLQTLSGGNLQAHFDQPHR